ncbi:MAG: hypothetical protein QGH73_08445 [Rhodospirillales bacterium]|jgi:hypothetical protein|nr:hypothetical protein [Rhodospirillales bacterium]MDP6645436.1 hypothetical protein [Rhodospirillales bacterium]MDP6841694.1 hypothetical protein [Rhodospirillales bacterium]
MIEGKDTASGGKLFCKYPEIWQHLTIILHINGELIDDFAPIIA